MVQEAGSTATMQPTVDVLVAGLGPGGCAAALAAHAEGLSTLAVEGRGPQGTRSRLVLVRPGAQAVLRQLGLPGLTQGRRASTIREMEDGLRAALAAAAAASRGPTGTPLSLSWFTRVVALQPGLDDVRVTLLDETSGQQRVVVARHVVDASGGRLESIGRPARATMGRRHLVATAIYDTPPWFDGIGGTRDAQTREALVLVPMRGRGSVTAYLDAPPGSPVDRDTLVRRFEAVARQLALGDPREDVLAVDVVQRLLTQPSPDRVLPIGDSVGTVDLWLGAGMSTAIEDALDVARGMAASQRASGQADQQAHRHEANVRILARHRKRRRQGRWMVAARPLIMRLWPAVPLEQVRREAVNCPAVLWPAMRIVAGRRPQGAG